MQSTEFLLHQRSGVVTAKSAKQWLKELPMADARSAHHAGSALLREVANAALAPFDRLEILETLRSHLAEIDLLYSRRYAGKSLPLGLAERNAFTHAQRQWRALTCAYLEIFELAADGAANLAARRALCLARAGGYFCDALKGHLRAGQAGAEEIVEDLQRLHELATEHGLVDTKVRDSLHPRGVTSIALIYSRALLIGQGATINGGLEREAMFALAQSWEGKIVCKALPIDARGEARSEARSEKLPPAPGERRQRLRQARFGQRMYLVDVTLLSRSLRRRMRKLGAGDPLLPDSLPEQFRQLPIREVLGRLHAIWCEQGDARLEQRSAAGGAPLAGRPPSLGRPRRLAAAARRAGGRRPAGALRRPQRHAADADASPLAPARPRGAGRHDQPRASAHAAAFVRLAPAAVERRPARGAGAAGPCRHRHHAGLHPARLPAFGQGLRRGASAGEEAQLRHDPCA